VALRCGIRLPYGPSQTPNPDLDKVLHVCIPVFNEAPTIGVLLWRLRSTFQEYSREYEVIVYDDASTDATAETLEPYTRVLPLTVMRSRERIGYAASLDALLRETASRTRYPRRDAILTMQADFTDQPGHIPELMKRFEGGADVVVGEQSVPEKSPAEVRRLRRVAPWVLRPFVKVPGVSDPFGAFRLYRVSVIRELIAQAGDKPLVTAEGWAANVELLVSASKVARRVETVQLDPRYDIRPRESRVRPLADALNLFRFGRSARRVQRAEPQGTT
jgi:glycosyltransferase involved in cell wall biosynthesis